MDKKTIGLIAIIFGGLFAIVSLTANFIGLGTHPGINSAQLIAATIGLWTFLVGVWLRRAKSSKKEQ